MSYKQLDNERRLRVHSTLNDIYLELTYATKVDKIEQLCNRDELKRFKFDHAKYPDLRFRLTQEDVLEMIAKGIISNSFEIDGAKLSDPLSKLLYAALWKQGDLLKVQHIIRGVLSKSEEEAESALVFYQFGKHLVSGYEPIVDQHVLRAYEFYRYVRSGHNGEFRSKSVISKNDRLLIAEYKKWLREELHEELRQVPKYTYHVDKLMFSIGKYIKSNWDIGKKDLVYSPS